MRIPPPTPRQMYWNRVLLNVFWMVLALYLASQLFISLSMWGRRPEFSGSYFKFHVLIPDSVVTLLLLALEAIQKWRQPWAELSIIAASHIYAALIIANLSPDYHVKPLIMLLPLLVSMIYLKSNYLKASSFVCLLYILMLFISTPAYEYALRIENIIIAFIFAGTSLAAFGVIGRGRDLMQSLENSVKSEQDLRIQNIIMDRLSKIDPLTDLYNHKTFHEYLGWLIDHQQNNPFPMQLAVLDIDNFKKVNDEYGHWVGDIVLRQVAQTLLAHIGTDDFAARYGGEEFVVILTAKPLDESLAMMEHILLGIASLPIAEMDNKTITVSIGMHEYDRADSKSSTFQQADDALYEAKKTGKNKIVIL
ncbi:GGDEF domain-containing protein [Paenibacillus sp. NFR01]|uniref:GGDEF domain-containing protein n=1 Tax=Paenibacillus sp. NFR01 TaxID=1566279 RepID=UPI0008B4ECB6|nr:GGDEF domain-containing protein [Paenibacillus sp. NFR01]SEU23896.1 diguanylate cyclase (GGDEF) domain-containing protein [Paenibacillus sp. NFR01]